MRVFYRRLTGGLLATLVSLALVVGFAGPSAAYIDSCDDPVQINITWTYKKKKIAPGVWVMRPIPHITLTNAVSGEPLGSWAEDRVFNPDAGQEPDGFFTVPVPKAFQGRSTQVSVQFVSRSRSLPRWMAQASDLRPWGGGHQVWLKETVQPGSSIEVGIPNWDPDDYVSEFMFEVVYKTRIGKKWKTDAFFFKPTNTLAFNQYEHESNGLTALTLR